MPESLKSTEISSSRVPGSLTLADWIRNLSSEKHARATSARGIRLVVSRLEAGKGSAVGDAVLGRLSDLGLAPGEAFEYFGRAPLGEPIFICVRETVLALRMEEAALIEIVGTKP